MKSEKTGTSMSRIENTRLISAVYCDCKKCFHSVNKNGMLYCKYYDLFSPIKKKCARYSFLDKGKKKRILPNTLYICGKWRICFVLTSAI